MVRLDNGVKHMMMSSKFLFVVVVVVQLQYKLAAEVQKPSSFFFVLGDMMTMI